MDSARWFAALARDLAEQADRDATASRVLELITGAIGCSFAAIGHLTPQGVLVYSNSTDKEQLGKLAAISTGTGEGIAWEALRTRATVRVEDLDTEDRWPRFTTRLRTETRIRSALGYCLTLDNLVRGAMLLFSDEPGFFTDPICRFADVYADHAAIALARVSEHERAENLETALQSNREIGMAVGILMVRYTLTDQAAFDLLRVTSQHHHRKLRDIAAETVYSGELPQREQPAVLRLA
jgi:transcriptional regulator with GAF, ATPase, and Fis domain